VAKVQGGTIRRIFQKLGKLLLEHAANHEQRAPFVSTFARSFAQMTGISASAKRERRPAFQLRIFDPMTEWT
jgi:hypothetical protein